MTTDLTMLAASAALCLTLLAAAKLRLPALAAPSGWTDRAGQASADMLETLIPFAVLVLAADAMDKTGLMSALGAQIVFWGCAAQVALTLAGFAFARSLAWVAGVAGMGLMAAALLQS